MTHSLEVAQIAKSIATRINSYHSTLLGSDVICEDIVEFAGLAHDLGHPPFGHQGEEMLDQLMKEYGGYEGNAQTLRILTKIEKKGFGEGLATFQAGVDKRVGLNLTARTLASILKYDKQIQINRKESTGDLARPQKGYYSFDDTIVSWIKSCCGGCEPGKKFKTIECQIMDLADDIAYSVYDLEDALKAGFYTLQDVVFAPLKLRGTIASKISIKYKNKTPCQLSSTEVAEVLQDLFEEVLQLKAVGAPSNLLLGNSYYEIFKEFSTDGYARSYLTSSIVNHFIEGIEFEYNAQYPSQSEAFFTETTLRKVEVLKKFTFTSQVQSSRLKIAEFRGKEIVAEIFEVLANEVKYGFELLPDDFREVYDKAESPGDKRRVVCDYVAGMTDRYAIEFYGRLKSENPETIFKPL